MVNPFPLVRRARRGRIEAHHNPLEPFAKTRRGRSARSSPNRAAEDPRRGVRPALRQALLAPRPGARRLLRLLGRSRLRVARCDRRRCRSGTPARHRHPQGNSRPPAGAGLARCLRLAPPLPGRGPRRRAGRSRPAAVVDAAPPAPHPHLRRLPGDVQPGERRARRELVTARPSPHRRLPDGSRPGRPAHRHPVGDGTRPSLDHRGLPQSPTPRRRRDNARLLRERTGAARSIDSRLPPRKPRRALRRAAR